MRRQTKNVISKYMSYDINNLVSTWETRGWRGLARLSRTLGTAKFGFGYGDDCETHRIKHALEETYEDLLYETNVRHICWPMYQWYTLVLIPPNAKYPKSQKKQLEYIPSDIGHGGSVADDTKLLKCYGKIADALANNKTLGGAFRKTVAPKILNAYVKSIRVEWEEDAEKVFRIKIRNKYAEAFQNIAKWTRKQASHEEVWWNCVWLLIRDYVKEMLQIQDRIVKDVPLTDEQFRFINEYMSYGNPRGVLVETKDGSYSYEIYLEVQSCQYLPYRYIVNVSCGLLTQPAFALGQQYLNTWFTSRFVAQCHAPSCGKMFYTGHQNATACPSKRSDTKSACALEWVRYKRYLQKVGENPEKNWDNLKLKEQFILYDSS